VPSLIFIPHYYCHSFCCAHSTNNKTRTDSANRLIIQLNLARPSVSHTAETSADSHLEQPVLCTSDTSRRAFHANTCLVQCEAQPLPLDFWVENSTDSIDSVEIPLVSNIPLFSKLNNFTAIKTQKSNTQGISSLSSLITKITSNKMH